MIGVPMQFEQPHFFSGGSDIITGNGIISCCMCWDKGWISCCLT